MKELSGFLACVFETWFMIMLVLGCFTERSFIQAALWPIEVYLAAKKMLNEG